MHGAARACSRLPRLATRGVLSHLAGGSSAACVGVLGARHVHSSQVACDIRTDGGGEAEDFIEWNLDQSSKAGAFPWKKADSAAREALSLYRDVWRASFLFVWTNEKGEEWKDIIRESARKEFEAARVETDPEMVARLLVTGRDYLDQAMQKFAEKRQNIIDEDDLKDGSNNGGRR